MKIKDVICEARKRPDQNPKLSVNQAIQDHLSQASNVAGSSIKNSFTSFTQLEKLGVFPSSEHATPLGIYAYPNEYVMSVIGKDLSPHQLLPFAGHEPFANIFSVNGNFLILHEVTDTDTKNYYKKITEFMLKILEKKSPTYSKGKIERFVDKLAKEASTSAPIASMPGGRLWNVSMKTAEYLAKELGVASAAAWRSVLRGIGFDGCIDNGHSIIHPSEPHQAVFFSRQNTKNVMRVHNKYSPSDVKHKMLAGAQQQQEDQAHYARIKQLETLEEQQEYVMKNPTAYKFLTKPTLEFEKRFLSKHPFKYIKNPSTEIQLIAVTEDSRNLAFIKNQSEQVQLAAIKNMEFEYQVATIKNPTPRVQLVAAQMFPSNAMKYIDSPTQAAQLEAIKQDPRSIKHVKNPSQKVQLAAVDKDPTVVQYIKNQTMRTQLSAVTQRPSTIRYCYSPSERVQLAAVNKDPGVIEHIKRPTETVQLTVISNDPSLIYVIASPTPKAKALAAESGWF